jgi:hypothetical protein
MKSRTKLILLGLITFVSVLIFKCRKEYYKEYNVVKNEFKKIDGIEIVEINGHQDVTLESIYATIKLRNGNTIGFLSLTEDDFKNPSSISVSHINQWQFNGISCLGNGNWNFLDIGKNSIFPEIRNLNLKNIQDLIGHFDELNQVVNRISVSPKFDTLRENGDCYLSQKYNWLDTANTKP